MVGPQCDRMMAGQQETVSPIDDPDAVSFCAFVGRVDDVLRKRAGCPSTRRDVVGSQCDHMMVGQQEVALPSEDSGLLSFHAFVGRVDDVVRKHAGYSSTRTDVAGTPSVLGNLIKAVDVLIAKSGKAHTPVHMQ